MANFRVGDDRLRTKVIFAMTAAEASGLCPTANELGARITCMKGVFLLLIITAICSPRSSAKGQKAAQETQVRQYWVDPSTGLMWAAQDNGRAVAWRKAESYCRNLRLAGYSDWRLATLDELATLVDKSPTPSNGAGNTETFSINIGNVPPHVRGGLSLSGNPWSSIREINRFGKPYGDGWFFDFVTSKPSGDLQNFRNTKYALCVRRPRE